MNQATPTRTSEQRDWLGNRLLRARFWTVTALVLAWASESVAQQQATALGAFGYQNQLYVPSPAPIPGLSDSPQPNSIAIFGGNVGPAGATSTPNDGTYFLVQSGFGQPVAEPRRPDFFIGQEIVPDPALQADLTKAPAINPPVKAFYLPDVHKVFANEAGFVQITWTRTDNSTAGPVEYLIDRLPVRTPMGVYHTHNPTPDPGSDFTASPLPPPQTKAPVVDVSGVQQIIFHWNTQLPLDTTTPYFVRTPSGTLYAKDKTGLMLLEYRENGVFLGIEIVELRSNLTPDGPATLADIGFQLTPFTPAPNPVPPVVTQGLGTGTAQLLYQHQNQASTQYGSVWPIRTNSDPANIELYWMSRSVKNVVWPYELHRYTASWPTDPTRYQLYVRGVGTILGPDVKIPAGITATLMPFQEPSGHANPVANNSFSTIAAGLSLLRYDLSNDVSFQVVRSVLHTDPILFPSGTNQTFAAAIGQEVVEPNHQGPRPGYLYVPEGNRYDWEIYDGNAADPPEFQTQQIFAVNTGLLEVWWSTLNQGVQWPSFVKRYVAGWPGSSSKIVIASLHGGGPIDPVTHQNYRLYYQNSPNLPGFNPNDEHALIADGGQGQAVFALRDDLGSPATSLPYCLLKYRDPSANLTWKYIVYKVVAEETPYFFNYSGIAGTLIQPPFPLSILQLCPSSVGVSGPYWQDRKLGFWARAAGDNGGPAQIVMRYFYPAQLSFFFPDTNAPAPGACVPWLDRRPGGTPGVPTDITYTVNWPSNAPVLNVGETLVSAKKGLPDIGLQTSAEIIYQQSVALSNGPSVKLIDPTRQYTVGLAQLPGDAKPVQQGAFYFFPDLPPHLRNRFYYDGTSHKLTFQGQFVQPTTGDYYLLLNVITARDLAVLLNLSTDASFRSAVNALAQLTANVTEVPPNTAGFASLALTAGGAQGPGYVTLAFGNNPILNPPAAPVSLSVIQVSCPTYRGQIEVINSDNPFDEKVTLRHSGDFAGKADSYIFEWRTLPPNNGVPTVPPDQWNLYTPTPSSGQGALDVTIQGAGLFTLSDNYFICRYRPVSSPLCTTASNVQGWSDWTAPMPALGWVNRVLNAIGPFDQRIQSYTNTDQVNTIVSMISQAGQPYNGDVPLNQQAANQMGLIQIYETVLRRGESLSINGLPAVNYGPANDALLRAASSLSDLYMLLGNEAYADAADPTIAFGTDDTVYGPMATSIHCFMNQTASLMEEELDLLRGRDDSKSPSVTIGPVYNRLIWNFTKSLDGGEVAYALNYNIRNQNGDVAGTIDEADAAILYPQGHGDAWGHYLSAITGYYQLLRNPNFTWVPRAQDILVGGSPVTVDYFDERKFATAAAARAQTGAEIVSLTYRNAYVEDPAGQWQGYQDTNTSRAWGVAEWGSRAGQGAYFDWVAGNALLPDKDPDPSHTDVRKIDRTTVSELAQIVSSFVDVQAKIDAADAGLNPLGLAKNVVPFDIDPSLISQGKTHFEQIYDRAVSAMNNAIAVFNRANKSTQLLRQQADDVAKFQQTVTDSEADFNSRLVEVFGYPYAEDIGPTGSYPTGYSGPDLYHYDYVDSVILTGENGPPAQTMTVTLTQASVGADGTLTTTSNNVNFNISAEELGLVKPASWSQRRAPGEIQLARSDILQNYERFQTAVTAYNNLIAQIEDRAALIRVQYNLAASNILILNQNLKTQESLNNHIQAAKDIMDDLNRAGKSAVLIADATAEFLPRVVGLDNDVTSAMRGGIKLAGEAASQVCDVLAGMEQNNVEQDQQDKEIASLKEQIALSSVKDQADLTNDLQQLEQVVRQESSSRLELYTLVETLHQSMGRYSVALAKGERMLEDRQRFRQQTATQIQAYRYKDMAFRIFRNDALQKYRAQFDLAAMYVYLAARAYDYETNLKIGDPRGPGADFMTGIIRSRSLGLIENGLPQTGPASGDPGLADPMARMDLDWTLVLKGQLGFNNPQTETGRFSLRSELFRIQAGATGNKVWRDTLSRSVVANMLDMPEFQRFCIPPFQTLAVEPAIVIPFSTSINFGFNFFGWPLGGGDNNYSSTHFATKIRSVGVWLANYNNLNLVNTPRVYLIPVGDDVMRSPSADNGDIRQWKILDQALPVPFPLSSTTVSSPSYIPVNDTLAGQLTDIRRYADFPAHPDSGTFNLADVVSDSRLIGRSVWNTRWLLIIPAGNLLNDRNEAIQRFINGSLLSNGQRDGNGVTDIKIFFQTYAYSGN